LWRWPALGESASDVRLRIPEPLPQPESCAYGESSAGHLEPRSHQGEAGDYTQDNLHERRRRHDEVSQKTTQKDGECSATA